MADQVPPDVRAAGVDRRIGALLDKLLNVVLAEVPLAGRIAVGDQLGGLGFADGDQRRPGGAQVLARGGKGNRFRIGRLSARSASTT